MESCAFKLSFIFAHLLVCNINILFMQLLLSFHIIGVFCLTNDVSFYSNCCHQMNYCNFICIETEYCVVYKFTLYVCIKQWWTSVFALAEYFYLITRTETVNLTSLFYRQPHLILASLNPPKEETFHFSHFRFSFSSNRNCNYIFLGKVYSAIITLPGGNSFFIRRHSLKQICLLNFQRAHIGAPCAS